MNDFTAPFAVTVFATSMSGVLLICACFISRYNRALAIWAISYLLVSVSAALIIARGSVDDFWSVAVAYTLLTAAFGLMWKGARRFENRPTAPHLVLAGATVWLFACLIGPVYASNVARIAIVSTIIIGYTLLIGIEFWRSSGMQLTLRWPAVAGLAIYAGTSLVRVLRPGRLLFIGIERNSELSSEAAISIELLFHVFSTGVLLTYLAVVCTSLDRAWGSIIDPSTGILSRRGFTECGTRALRLTYINDQCATLVGFDLNWLEAVNAGHGRSVGESTLCTFCEVVSEATRPCDLFGRVGNRQFACLLANVSHPEAVIVVEGIKGRIANMEANNKMSGQHLIINIAYAVAGVRRSDLPTLMREAEDGLLQFRQHAFMGGRCGLYCIY